MEITQLKQQLPILEVAHHLGIRADKTGKAHCPFHEDKKPSLQFSKEKNIATCFSSRCHAGTMDIISLTEKYLKLTTHEAIVKLKEWAGAAPMQPKPATKTTEGSELGRIALLTKAFSTYKIALKSSKTALAYLERRSLDPLKVEAGYNSGQFYQKATPYFIESCKQAGLLKAKAEGTYQVFAKGCIIFPLRNKENQLVSLYGRSTTDTQDQKHYYLQGRSGLYPCHPPAATQTLILTESIIDAATLLQSPLTLTIPNITILACYGTNGFTEEHITAIQALKDLKEIILFFDGDEPGRKGAGKISEQLFQLPVIGKLKITIADTPEGEDINSLAQSHEKAIFPHLLENRKPFLFSIENKKEHHQKPADIENPTAPSPSTFNSERSTLNATSPYKLTYHTITAHYTINGGVRKEADSLKVSLVVEHPQSTVKHRSKLDLYEDKQVERIAKEAAEKLGLRADLVEVDLSRLTDLLEQYRDRHLLTEEKQEKSQVTLNAAVANECRTFLSKPHLIQRLNELIGQAGVIGEENNRIFLLGIASSYKMPHTLHALIQGSSGSGKTHLLIKISDFIPPESSKRFTRVTESSFYNYSTHELTNKLICLEDLDGLKEEAFFAFRELQSRGLITSSTSGKDEQGNIKAYEKTVYGPIASLSATTKGEIYEDNMNRCFLIAVDESKEQTQRIISYQNKKAAGHIDTKKEQQITHFIQNCIRLLKPYPVINPYADKVTLPREAHKIRRLNDLYQSYVKQITLLNQYSRKQDAQGRLISEKEDLQVAAEIMFDSIVLKIDELDGSLRLFYEKLKDYVKAKGGQHQLTYRFSQRDIRQTLHISKTQLHRYIHDLLSLEYIRAVGGHANTGFEYKILYWDNIQALRAKVKRHLQGQLDQLELIPV